MAVPKPEVDQLLKKYGYQELIDHDPSLAPGRQLPGRVDATGQTWKHMYTRLDPDGTVYPPIMIFSTNGQVDGATWQRICDFLASVFGNGGP